jgi:hypothetical protein
LWLAATGKAEYSRHCFVRVGNAGASPAMPTYRVRVIGLDEWVAFWKNEAAAG